MQSGVKTSARPSTVHLIWCYVTTMAIMARRAATGVAKKPPCAQSPDTDSSCLHESARNFFLVHRLFANLIVYTAHVYRINLIACPPRFRVVPPHFYDCC